jgi:hypothetical protein
MSCAVICQLCPVSCPAFQTVINDMIFGKKALLITECAITVFIDHTMCYQSFYWSHNVLSQFLLITECAITVFIDHTMCYHSFYWSQNVLSQFLLITECAITVFIDHRMCYHSFYWSHNVLSQFLLITQCAITVFIPQLMHKWIVLKTILKLLWNWH